MRGARSSSSSSARSARSARAFSRSARRRSTLDPSHAPAFHQLHSRQTLSLPPKTKTQKHTTDLVKAYGCAGRSIIFTETKNDANELAASLAEVIPSRALHGDIAQSQREVVLAGFRSGKFSVLVATDVAARGLDISGIELVLQARCCAGCLFLDSVSLFAAAWKGRGEQGTAALLLPPPPPRPAAPPFLPYTPHRAHPIPPPRPQNPNKNPPKPSKNPPKKNKNKKKLT